MNVYIRHKSNDRPGGFEVFDGEHYRQVQPHKANRLYAELLVNGKSALKIPGTMLEILDMEPEAYDCLVSTTKYKWTLKEDNLSLIDEDVFNYKKFVSNLSSALIAFELKKDDEGNLEDH